MPKVFIISALSGTGKTSLNNRLARELPEVEVSISATSRPIRSGETAGKSYHFVAKNDFQQMIEKRQLLEYAEVFGNFYGTRIDDVKRIMDSGRHVILEIDVQGFQSIKTLMPEATGIFILPPSLKTVWERLELRGTDSFDSRLRRLKAARDEILHSVQFDYFILNADFDEAFSKLKGLILGDTTAALDKNFANSKIDDLLQEYADWDR